MNPKFLKEYNFIITGLILFLTFWGTALWKSSLPFLICFAGVLFYNFIK